MKALYSGTTAPMTFKLHRLMVLIGSTTLALPNTLTLGSLGQRSRSQDHTSPFYMKALYSETTAPMTFKLHRLMLLIGSTTHADFGITKSKVKVKGLYFNFLHEGPLLANFYTHDL